MESFLAVIAANRERQRMARELNTRAGSDLFKVYSRSELAEFTCQKLAGARRMVEVADTSVITLPSLDETLVAKVLMDNPDEITVLGEPRKVAYRQGFAPMISFDDSFRQGNLWMQIHDEGVYLPSGRQVEVQISFGYYCTFHSVNIPELKEKVREYLNREQWERFMSSGEKPEIVLPNPVTVDEVSPIYECRYGTCSVTNEPLFAFGVVTVKRYCYSGELIFEVRWTQRHEEAEALRTVLVEKLSALRKKIAERSLLDTIRLEAQVTKERIKDVYGIYRSLDDRNPTLQDALYSHAYGYLPEKLEDLRCWIVEVSELCRKALAEISKVKAEAQRREDQKIERQKKEESFKKGNLGSFEDAFSKLGL